MDLRLQIYKMKNLWKKIKDSFQFILFIVFAVIFAIVIFITDSVQKNELRKNQTVIINGETVHEPEK